LIYSIVSNAIYWIFIFLALLNYRIRNF